MTTNSDIEILTNSIENTDNNIKEVRLPPKIKITNSSKLEWYEKSEHLHEIYNANNLSPSPKTWIELKEWFNYIDKEFVSSLDIRVLLLWIPFDDFMLKNNAKNLLAEKGLLTKRDFESIWKNRGKELDEESEFVNVYHEIETKLREKFDIVSYKSEILVKIDNAYTNNLDILLTYLYMLIKEEKMSYRGLKGDVLECLKDSRIVKMNFFCYDSWLLNFKNGYYNFRTNKFTKAKNCIKNFIFSINKDYTVNVKADCPIFKKALDRNLEGNKIIKKEDIFEFMAYSLMFGNFLKAFFLNIGESNTGKTQVMEVLKAFVPTNNRLQVSMYRLTSDQFGTMGLNNIILIYYDDMGTRLINDVSMIKTITGGASEISVEVKHGAKKDTRNTGKIWQNGNYLPKIHNSKDVAYLDRAVIIEFNNPFDRYSKEHKEQFYLTITENKAEIEGIVSEYIKAGKRLYERGNFRKEIKDYSKEHYNYKSSEIFAFLKDFTVKNAKASISFLTAKDLVNGYRAERKKTIYTSQQIKREFEYEGFFKIDTSKHDQDRYVLKGLRWKNTVKVQRILDKFN